MGEIKSVKVDNWGVFFLQKLQNFFNKTDYCDLTLQFNDNSQLKVHRLVLSACTDYFNVLEQTCEVIDDALLMPNELQADVVVPIVNFMYTGTLEFELKMYGKLLRTAKEMNMTVLLKLLEAHRRTMEGVNRAQQRPSSPKNIRKRGPGSQASPHSQMRSIPNSPQQQQQPQQRRILTTSNAGAPPQRRLVQTKLMTTNSNQPPQIQQYRSQIGSTSLLKTSVSGTSPLKIQRNTHESSTQASSAGESQMLFKEEQQDDYEAQLNAINQQQPTSPFEQLRKGYNNNKRPATATFISPPAKKPNIEDVKEFAEQQRMRKQIAAEYADDPDYPEGPMLDDDIHNDDDIDDDAVAASSSISSASTTATPTSTSVKQQQHHQQGPSIIIKQEPNEKPTIVVKDSANSKMNHAKIISEVLRQYPHLVKSNKNIKLKIMPNVGGGQSQKIIVKKEQIDNISAEMTSASSSATANSNARATVTQQTIISKPSAAVEKASPPTKPAPLPQLPRAAQKSSPAAVVASSTAITTTTTSSAAAAAAAVVPAQKRRIDSKTMHALIAQGAENTTGPWLCLRCGVNGRPISIPSYRGFRRHLINTHKETIDPALCEHCGWRSKTNRELHFHTQVEHKIKTTVYTFPECLMCAEIFIDTDALNEHMIESHPDENQQQCIYCNKIFAKELQLYTHMKTYHKKQAIDDGIIDYSEGDDDDDDDDGEPMETQDDDTPDVSVEERPQTQNANAAKKIKILSDISLPSAGSLMKLEPSSEAAALTTIASGIATSIGLETSEEYINASDEVAAVHETAATEPKFVTADGNEMVLTDEQRKEIMSQLNQEHEGGVVMVLNDTVPFSTDGTVATAAAAETSDETSQDLAAEQSGAEQAAESSGAAAVEHMETSADEEEDYEHSSSNIYNDFVNKSDRAGKKDSSALEESNRSIDNLEWAENLLNAHEMEEETNAKTSTKQNEEKEARGDNVADKAKERKKNEEDISKKLKELTGDWSDDEIDEDEEMLAEADTKPNEAEEEKDEKTQESEAVEESTETDEKDSKEVAGIGNEHEDQAADEINKSMEDDEKHAAEAEDDVDVAMKSLHRDEMETTDASDIVNDEIPEELDSTDDGHGHVKVAANVSSEIEEEDKLEDAMQVEENKNLKLGHGIESETALESKESVACEEDKDKNEDDAVAKSSKCSKDATIVAEAEVLEELKDDDEEKASDAIVSEEKSNEQEATKTAEEEEGIEDVDAKHDADENVCVDETEDTKTESKSGAASPSAVEAIKVTEATTETTSTTATTSTTTTTTSTEDKVKTLISDWGDDDDDEEEQENNEVEELGTLI